MANTPLQYLFYRVFGLFYRYLNYLGNSPYTFDKTSNLCLCLQYCLAAVRDENENLGTLSNV